MKPTKNASAQAENSVEITGESVRVEDTSEVTEPDLNEGVTKETDVTDSAKESEAGNEDSSKKEESEKKDEPETKKDESEEKDKSEMKKDESEEKDKSEVKKDMSEEKKEIAQEEKTGKKDQEEVSGVTVERKQRKSRYFLMLVRELPDGTMTQHTISSAIVEAVTIALFVMILFGACRLIYNSVVMKKMDKEMIDQIVQLNNLVDENESLAVENSTLNSKITVLSETVSKLVADEDIRTMEESENALPKGFPLSGAGNMMEAMDGEEPILEFSTSVGLNVISTGSGTVISADVDPKYGFKVIVDHGNGFCSVYRNSGAPLVRNGDTIEKGHPIFNIGEDNLDFGYQISQDEVFINPMDMLEING